MTYRKFVAVAAALGLSLAGAQASAADRPGTPNQERADIVGPDRIRVSWHNTAYTGDFYVASQPPAGLTFGVEAQTDTTIPGRSYPLDNNGRASVLITGLKPGAHCFRIWSRLNTYLSGQPSAWACATLPEPMAYVTNTAPLAIGTMRPNYGRDILWLGLAEDMTRVDDGFVLIVRANAPCPAGWRMASYQNGGWPGLGPAGYLNPHSAYGICWAAEPPAPLPAPPLRPLAPKPAPPVH